MPEVFETELWCDGRGHFNSDQALFVKDLVQSVKPTVAIETGFCTGRSCSSVMYYGAEWLKTVISIDISGADSNIITKLELEFPDIDFKVLPGDSTLVLKEILSARDLKIDWATIDGGHSYRECKSDLDDVHSYMNPGGVIIIDDYKSGPPHGCYFEEVENACQDFWKEHKDLYTLTEWNVSGKGVCIFTRK